MRATQVIHQLDEGGRNAWLKVSARSAPNFESCHSVCPRMLKRARTGQRVVHLREQCDARHLRNVIALETIRVALAVPFFMVLQGDLLGRTKRRMRTLSQYLRTNCCVLLHHAGSGIIRMTSSRRC